MDFMHFVALSSIMLESIDNKRKFFNENHHRTTVRIGDLLESDIELSIEFQKKKQEEKLEQITIFCHFSRCFADWTKMTQQRKSSQKIFKILSTSTDEPNHPLSVHFDQHSAFEHLVFHLHIRWIFIDDNWRALDMELCGEREMPKKTYEKVNAT